MMSFSQFLQEGVFSKKQFKIEKPETKGDEEHTIRVGKGQHRIFVTYNRNPDEKSEYSMHFGLSHKKWPSKFRRETKNALFKSAKTFVKRRSPARIYIMGDTESKHDAWGHMGPKLAKHLGGKFIHSDEEEIGLGDEHVIDLKQRPLDALLYKIRRFRERE